MRLCTAFTPRFPLSRRLLSGLLTAWLLVVGSTIFSSSPVAAGVIPLHSFAGGPTDGAHPDASLVQGTDGAFYGTTKGGSTGCYSDEGCGTVFKLNADGSGFTLLHSFTGSATDGAYPYAGLIQGTDGAFYGTTFLGGSSNRGTVFKLNADGSGFTLLHSFTGSATDGAYPYAGLIQGTDGALYGTTWGGAFNPGTVFKLNADGSGFTLLHAFTGSDGAGPEAGLIQGTDGALYGTTYGGGSSNRGTVFKLNTDGSGYSVLYHFTGGDGANPSAGLIQGTDGALYGTTAQGGSLAGIVFMLNTDGSGFTLLHSFPGVAFDGVNPYANLIQGTDGALYGTTGYGGGSSNSGIVFRLNVDGSGYSVLHHFAGGVTDGAQPFAGLIQGTDGALYGTTYGGGSAGCYSGWGCGTVFKLVLNGPDLAGTWNSLTQICRTVRGTQRCRLMGGVSVTNQGNARAPRASFLRFFLSSDGATPEIFLRQVAVGALRAGQMQARRLSVPLPLGTTATGKFVVAVIDATNGIVETVETNNVKAFGPIP